MKTVSELMGEDESRLRQYFRQWVSLRPAALIFQPEFVKKYKEGVYFGSIINSKRHGPGVMLYLDGRVYQGEWEAGYKHGQGVQTLPDKGIYSGEFVNGRFERTGTFKWFNGQEYEGQWVDGSKHGYGIWKGPRGDSYIGEWKNNRSQGYGVHTWVNGDRYQGQFRSGLKHGSGKEVFTNGDFYTGQYVSGKPEGCGEYRWRNGDIYKGHFRRGLRHGTGEWRNGDNSQSYSGEYKNDKKSGVGTYCWQNGNSYCGQFFNDLRNGRGVMRWADGSVYDGDWIAGVEEGLGMFKNTEGNTVRGRFCNAAFVQQKPTIVQYSLRESSNRQRRVQIVKQPQYARRSINVAKSRKWDQQNRGVQSQLGSSIVKAGEIKTRLSFNKSGENKAVAQAQFLQRRKDQRDVENRVIRIRDQPLKPSTRQGSREGDDRSREEVRVKRRLVIRRQNELQRKAGNQIYVD